MNEIATTTDERRLVQFTNEQKRILKSTVAQDHSDDELALFLSFCKSKGLDPFAREVYSIKRKGKVTFQIGIDGARAKAEESGEYDGQEVFWCSADGMWRDVWLESTPPAAAKVIAYRRGCQKPFTGIAKWTEYKPDSDDWMWRKMPANQLAKCAESLALRRAFPNKLGGLYTGEEMQQADAAANPPEPKRSIIQPKMKTEAIPAAVEDEPTPENPVIDFPPQETAPPEPEPEHPSVVKVQKALAGRVTEKQRKLIFARMNAANMSEEYLRTYLKKTFNTEHTSELRWQDLDKLLEWIDSYKGA